MNFLAHLYLAESTPEAWIGNLLPDLCKPKDWQRLPEAFQKGCYHHQWVDKLTDQHPTFVTLKSTLSSDRRRYAGIILDVCLDHYLARNWHLHHPQSLTEFLAQVYPHFHAPGVTLPERPQRVLGSIASQDWLSGYGEMAGLARAFQGLSRRMRFNNHLAGAEDEFARQYDTWMAGFAEILTSVAEQTKVARRD